MGEYINSKQTQFNKSYVSCGILEVHHLPNNSPHKTLFSIANTLYHKANPRPNAFFIFSDVVNDGSISRGDALAAHITKINLCGDMHESKSAINPRTGNLIKVWLIRINHDTFRKWYQEELANLIDE